MNQKEIKVGMRTFKTAISVALCLIVIKILERGNPIISIISTVVVLRETWQSSLDFGKARFLGNFVGAFAAFFMTLFRQYYFNYDFLDIILIPLIIIIIITFLDYINYNTGIVGCIATFLVIYYSIPLHESALYGFLRLIDVLIGALIAISVNFILDKEFLKIIKLLFKKNRN